MDKRKNNSEKTIDNKSEKNVRRNFVIKLIVFLLISVALLSTLFIKDKIENFVNFYYNENALSTVIAEDGLKIHFIDVGQGDSTLIEFPNNEIMLIDCGDNSTTARTKLINYLNTITFSQENGENVIDYFLLTHPDSDHIGNADYIFDNFKVKSCYQPDIYSLSETLPEDTSLIVQSDSELYEDVIQKLLQEQDCERIKTIQHLEISSEDYNPSSIENDPLNWIINFYAPVANELPYREVKSEESNLSPISNDYSPIIILSYLDKKFMFTGDASEDSEKDFIEFYNGNSSIDFDIDFLKIGHHGSRYSTTTELLNFVMPEYAVISVGQNSYGHPSEYTIERLTTYGLETNDIYRTDLNGNITVGVSTSGELSLTANYIQYTKFKFEWWQIYLILELIILIIIYFSDIISLIKKSKKRIKKLGKINE